MNCAVHSDTPAAAYCRTCGKALCENCKRDVQGAIYCEPCIAARLQGGPVVPPTSAPSPGVAMLLGFIPGVGAMYNGQFIKGFVHVVIFVMLIIGASEFHGPIDILFGLLIPFSIFYMAFDAYKTAEARMLGRPAPDPLGIDKMFGLQESQPPASAAAPAAQVAATAPVPNVAPPPAQAPPSRNEPIGAIVLIALGVIFLLGNFTHFDLHKFWPLILVGVGLWIAYKRLSAGTGEAR
jgi:TM2 domain-containing membrane protein YozV